MNKGFEIQKCKGNKNGMFFDSKTIFYCDKTSKIEAEYYYHQGKCNYLLSWGFTKGSLGESRKTKALKTKKPFFSLQTGWTNE